MTGNPWWLLDHRQDVYSQCGEDGIVGAILDRLPSVDRWCVEFGAWDGMHLSNTRHLIEARGYAAVLIEGSRARAGDLARNYASNPRVHAMNAFVGFTAENNLDTLLSDLPIPEDFDFLSIDIDGNDWHVWKAIRRLRPKVVVIEFNPTIPTPVSFVQEADPSVSQGCSLRACVELGKEKGYELVCVTEFNAFFVRAEYFPLFEISDNRPETLRRSEEFVTYLFSGYDGHVYLHGSGRMPWHGIEIKAPMVQQLPDSLQRFPDSYSGLDRLRFRTFRLLRRVTRLV
jgi:hypothetical protein